MLELHIRSQKLTCAKVLEQDEEKAKTKCAANEAHTLLLALDNQLFIPEQSSKDLWGDCLKTRGRLFQELVTGCVEKSRSRGRVLRLNAA